MSDNLKEIIRRSGKDDLQERSREQWDRRADVPEARDEDEEDKTATEARHDHYRRKQEFASRLGPTAERLPIVTKEEMERRSKDRPKRRKIAFEGPIEKLIEKYKDPQEVFNHLSIGQLMKYHLDEETGCIYEKDRLIFDGEKLV